MDSEDPKLSKAEVERRQYRRVKLVTQVHCEALERNEILVTRDVSMGGMFINVKFPLPIDSELSLTFRLYPAEPAITCRAQVMFSRVGLGMGIQFLDLSAEARQTLQKFVDEVD
ncbi:MAG: PilZ domain-containing protein [Terriglobia bacterium]